MWIRASLAIGVLLGGLLSAARADGPSNGETWPHEWALPTGVTFQLRGRIDTDAIACSQSEENEADFGELEDVVGLLRARIGIEGELWHDGSYVGEIDLATGDVVIRDLYAGMPGWFDGQTRLGHFREPFSLEGGTSARFFAFMERSPANVLDPARNWGLGLYEIRPTEDSALAVGAFYDGPDQNDFEGGPGSNVGLTAKLTTAPIFEQDGRYLLHLGAALSERLPLDNVVVINQKPQSPLLQFDDSTTSPFVPTLMIPANFQHILNLQLAASHGPLWSEAEWYGTLIDQIDGGTVFYQGNHVDFGYFVTGEHREYLPATGVLGHVRVNRPFLCGPASHGRDLGAGAWELTARMAWLDFIDPNTPPGPDGQLQGVQLTQATFGINWYLTDRLRMMLNYTHAEPTEPNLGQSSASTYAMRLAYFW